MDILFLWDPWDGSPSPSGCLQHFGMGIPSLWGLPHHFGNSIPLGSPTFWDILGWESRPLSGVFGIPWINPSPFPVPTPLSPLARGARGTWGQIWDFGLRILGSGFRVLGLGLDFGMWIVRVRIWGLVFGVWIWVLVFKVWTLGSGFWGLQLG